MIFCGRPNTSKFQPFNLLVYVMVLVATSAICMNPFTILYMLRHGFCNKVYPGAIAGASEANLMALNELRTHAFLQVRKIVKYQHKLNLQILISIPDMTIPQINCFSCLLLTDRYNGYL